MSRGATRCNRPRRLRHIDLRPGDVVIERAYGGDEGPIQSVLVLAVATARGEASVEYVEFMPGGGLFRGTSTTPPGDTFSGSVIALLRRGTGE